MQGPRGAWPSVSTSVTTSARQRVSWGRRVRGEVEGRADGSKERSWAVGGWEGRGSWRRLGRKGHGSREMTQGQGFTLLTSSLEGLCAKGTAMAVEEGRESWARVPHALSSALIPAPRAPWYSQSPPQPTFQVHRPHL